MVKLLSDQSTRPWAIVRILPKARAHTVARFRNRQDADDHVRVLHQAMQPLRHRINPQTFVRRSFLEESFAITLRQLAKYLKMTQAHILNWEKWHNVLWVHIKGRGGYFISYRFPRTVDCRLSQRYTEEALARLEAIWQQRYSDLSNRPF